MWGELIWQLGGKEAFTRIAEADGASPGKNVLRDLLELHAPCVILIDELVAYPPIPGRRDIERRQLR